MGFIVFLVGGERKIVGRSVEFGGSGINFVFDVYVVCKGRGCG